MSPHLFFAAIGSIALAVSLSVLCEGQMREQGWSENTRVFVVCLLTLGIILLVMLPYAPAP